MPRKKIVVPDVDMEESVEEFIPKVEGLASENPAPPSPAKEVKDRILIPLSDSGGIDLGSMREKTRDKLISALRRSQSDLFPRATPESSGMAIPDAAITAIYNLIGVGETMLASSRFPSAIAARAFMWTESEVALIRDPSKALIAKYAHKLRGFEEETTWALVFVQIHFAKMHTLRTLMAEESARVDSLRQAPGPKPDGLSSVMPGSVSPGDSAPPDGVQ